jgi:UDP-glucose 4-epimerase
MRILVLGGDGFIGSHFIDKVVSSGKEVTVFDRFPHNVSKNLEHQRGRIKFISGEFANREELAMALKGQDFVYHFIWATTPATSWNDPFIEIDTNLKNTVQLFELAASSNVKKIIFPSSGGAIYGRQHDLINENMLPNPYSPYGIVKLATEYFTNYFREHWNIPVDIYRIGNAYGPRQSMHSPQGVIAVWMGKILMGERLEVYGGANAVRDYIYVEDIADLMVHSINQPYSSDAYNVGTGIGLSVVDLLEILRAVVDEPFEYKVFSGRDFDNTKVVLDSSKLLRFFPGFKFKKIEDKLKDTWIYLKKMLGQNNRSVVSQEK